MDRLLEDKRKDLMVSWEMKDGVFFLNGEEAGVFKNPQGHVWTAPLARPQPAGTERVM